MLDSKVFYERKALCEACKHWKGVCLKGHALSSPIGCPIRKFPPVEGAVYLDDRPPAVPQVITPGPCCGQGANQETLREMTYPEALSNLASSMAEWAKAGFPLVTEEVYGARLKVCQGPPTCGFYRWYQCRICKCVVVAKAKLGTMKCPGGFWPA